MNNINKFQHFPFHLVDQSPWPILLSFSLLNLTIGAVLYMHGFQNGGTVLLIGFILTVSGMTLWFRDIIVEGRALSFFHYCHLEGAGILSNNSLNIYKF